MTISFPSGRTAAEIVPRDAAALAWMANLGCLELHPHPVRADDLDHPDELRVDLDPGPGVDWDDVRRVALVVREVLDDHGLRGWPKTSGSRGMHVNVRIERRWTFDQVRRSALALAREVERRAPELATSKWWKEERHGVFLDYNQNAKDRTVASAWSVRPTPDARVSMPLDWDEVPDCDPAAFTLVTAPKRLAERGDAAAGIDEAAGSLDKLLELSAAQEAEGQGDAPWPPALREAGRRAAARHAVAEEGREGKAQEAPTKAKGTGRRQSKHPLITISKAEHKEDALAGLERWKTNVTRRPPRSSRSTTSSSTRCAGNTRPGRASASTSATYPKSERPAEEAPDPDYDPWEGWEPGGRSSLYPPGYRNAGNPSESSGEGGVE